MIALATMQGMGKPGSNIWSTTQGTPVDYDFYFPGYAEGGISGDCENSAAGFKFAWRMFDGKTTFPSPSNINTSAGQHIPRLKVPECIMDGKFQWSGKGFCGGDIQHQMHQYTYPAPGYPKIKMLWKYGGPEIGTMTATNRYAQMYTHPSLEFVVSQSIWNEGEVQFADLILPACTNFERWDISEFANCSGYIPDTYGQCNHRVISLQAKCIEPVGESKSDYDIYCMIADKLGIGPMFTEGKTDLEWVEQYYNATDMPKHMTFARVQGEGLLHRARQPEAQEDVGPSLVRRRPRERHARLGSASQQPGGPQGPADEHRQGRVHLHQPQELRGAGLRGRVPAGHAHLCARMGRPALRACQEVPARDAVRRTPVSPSTPWVTARTAS